MKINLDNLLPTMRDDFDDNDRPWTKADYCWLVLVVLGFTAFLLLRPNPCFIKDNLTGELHTAPSTDIDCADYKQFL